MDNATRLTNARALMATARAEAEAALAVRLEALQTEVDSAVWALHHVDGLSVNAIGRVYGTKDWATVRNALRRAEQVLGTDATNATGTPASTTPTNTTGYDWTDVQDADEWVVTHPDEGTAHVDKVTGKVLPGPGLALAMRLDAAHPAWQAMPKRDNDKTEGNRDV